ncbi:hypothetical protein ACWGF2_30150 [Streptomyces sp. NPDC054919]
MAACRASEPGFTAVPALLLRGNQWIVVCAEALTPRRMSSSVARRTDGPVAQYPYLLGTHLSLTQAAAPESTL